MQFDLARAIARSERRDSLRTAEQNAQWVIRRRKTVREKSKSEFEKRVCDSLTCFHGLSYTLACKKCRRDERSAKNNLDRIKAKLSIA